MFKLVQILSIAEKGLFPLVFVGLLQEFVEALEDLGVLRVNLDLQLYAEQDSLFIDACWHPSGSRSLVHPVALLLNVVVL